MSVKGEGGVPPKSVTFFLAKILSVKGGGGTPLTDKIRKVVFEGLPYGLSEFDSLLLGSSVQLTGPRYLLTLTSRRMACSRVFHQKLR